MCIRDSNYVDQLKNVIDQIRNNPDSRRLIVCAWNPLEVDKMALPPCHSLFQFYVNDGKLSCMPVSYTHLEYNFVGWFYFDSDQSEKLVSTDATYTFMVNEERYVYAKFIEKEMHLFNAYPNEAGYITENGQEIDFGNGRRVEKGTQITLTAHVKVEGYRFVGWYTSTDQSETLISTDATLSLIHSLFIKYR